jgi:hypothetical protein
MTIKIIKCIIIIIILILLSVLLVNKESFESNTNPVSEIDIIENNNLDPNNSVKLADIMLDDNTLIKYLNKKELDKDIDINNPLSNKLPLLIDNDYKEYNHNLRELINSKKINQNYIIDLLSNKINILLNSTNNINNIK